MFNELIHLLKKVKKNDDVTNELVDHLINASLVTSMALHNNVEPDMSPVAAIKITRMVILEHIDSILFDMQLDDDLFEDE